MKIFKTVIIVAIFGFATEIALAEGRYIATIKPIHSLLSGVLEDVDTPEIIVDGANSPHTFNLKPSHAHALEHAEYIFWMGNTLEPYLARSIDTLGRNATIVDLSKLPGLSLLPIRTGGDFEEHDHDHGHTDHTDHDDHDAHDDDDHDHDHEHEHDDHAELDSHDDHEHDTHDDDEHADHSNEYNQHFWLDPENAKVFIKHIRDILVKAEPSHAEKFKENTEKMLNKIDQLTTEIDEQLEPYKGRGFIVFHDAYQYFEDRFKVTAIGSILLSPEIPPSAERISEIRHKLEESDATCVFSEPQFQPKIINTVTEGTNTKTGQLDPLGASITNGPNLYFELMKNIANGISECLSVENF